MTDAERAFLERVHRKASTMTPELAALLLSAYRLIAASLPESEMAHLITIGAVDTLILAVLSDASLDLAFRQVQRLMRRSLETALTYAARDLPKAGKVNGQLVVMFDHLDPNVIRAIETLDAKILPTLKADVRETIRQAIQAGLESGVNPRTIARGLRDVVGLSPAQELAVRNYRAELIAGDVAAAEARALHDARFVVTESMSAEKIDRMVAAYRRSMQGFHAETISRTATLDAFKKAQRLSWQQAIDAGIVDGGRLIKTWIQVDRPTKREAHIPLNGETVPFDQPYSNGEMVPGEAPDEWNCACLSRVFVGRAA
jgi:hypothetical protein